jgi:hypothetical protein
MAGDHDEFGVGVAFAAAPEHLHAVHLVHAQLAQHHVEWLFLQQGQGIAAALGGGDRVARLLHRLFQVFHGDLVVVHDQQPSSAHAPSVDRWA